MQPYFLPYIGYWQLMNVVDVYVVYDNIEYTKRSWLNRNRILVNGTDSYITIPLKKDSDYLSVNQRSLSEGSDRSKLLNQIKGSYLKAPYFRNIFPSIEEILMYPEDNLFKFIFHSIQKIVDLLHINTELIISSTIDIDHSVKGKNKVIAICKELRATEYYNTIGGQSLYDKKEFEQNGIKLLFVQARLAPYKQFNNAFVSGLSIIDILMFNPPNQIDKMLNEYNLL